MHFFIVYRFLFIGSFLLALGLVVYVVASTPSRVASRLGMRGLKRQRALQGASLWGVAEPFVRWLGVRVSGVIPPDFAVRLDERLQQAGDYRGLTPEEYVALTLVGFLFGIAGGVIFGFWLDHLALCVCLSALVGGMLPYVIVSEEARHRSQQISNGLPYVIDLMALAMSAGLDLPGAIHQVVEKSSNADNALTEELTRMLQEMQLGQTRKDVLLQFAYRAPLNAVAEFVGALVQAEERGNPVADVLLVQADSARLRRSVRAEEAAARAGIAMTFPLFLVFGCILLLVLGPVLLNISRME